MKKSLLLAGILIALVLCIGSAQAAILYDVVVYDSFGPDNGFSSSDGWGVGTSQYLAFMFMPSGDSYLDNIEVPISGSGSLSLSLLGDSGGGPGAVIESLGSATVGQTGNVVQFDSSTNPLLQGGQQYWVGMFPGDPNSWGQWHLTSASQVGLFGYMTPGSGWNLMRDIPSAMRVNGSSPNPVPEPSSLLVLIGGVGGLGGMLFRRRR